MSDLNSPTPDRSDEDQRLDALVRRASRTDVDRFALERLARQWRRNMDAPSRSSMWLPLAVAACIGLLATALVLFMARPWDDRQQGAQGDPQSGPRSGQSKNEPEAVDSPKLAQSAAPEAGGVASATPYEQLVMVAALRQLPPTEKRPARSVRRDLVDRLSSLNEVDDQTARRFATDLGVCPLELEREVGRLCLVLRGPRRDRAVELLGRVVTRESLDVLLHLWAQSAFQERLTPIVARLAGQNVLAQCYVKAGSSGSRAILAASLIERLNPGDFGLLIELLVRTRQSPELLAALRQADASLAGPLLAALDHESRTVRYTAAQALGALNRPEVTRRLIDRVASGDRRREALLALASSDEPIAVQFIARAKAHTGLANALRSAFVQAGTTHLFYGG